MPLDEKSAKKNLRPVIRDALAALADEFAAISTWSAADIHAAMERVAEAQGLKFGKIGQPLRVAVTGGPISPPIDATVELVGKERTLLRLGQALAYIDARIAAG